MTYSREVLPAPAELATDGHCHMGTFNGPIARVNPLDAHRPLGFAAPKPFNYFRLKEWEAFQIASDEWFLCLAVYNTKSIGHVMVVACDRHAGRMYRYERRAPFWKLAVPSGLADSHCYYHGRNFIIDIHNQLKNDQISVSFRIQEFRDLPDCWATFTGYHETEPIVIVQPLARNRPLYSHKALMPAEGSLTVGGKTSEFSRRSSCLIVDDHKGYYPYTLKYDWVTGLGYDDQERLVGFNLTDNQVQDPEKFNENCLWLAGRMHPLPPIRIHRPAGVNGTWRVRDEYGMVRLSFTPKHDLPISLKLGLAQVRYHGPAGTFEGFILDPEGNPVSFDGFFGMGEKKFVRL